MSVPKSLVLPKTYNFLSDLEKEYSKKELSLTGADSEIEITSKELGKFNKFGLASLIDVQRILNEVDLLSPPKQNEFVEQGHMVDIKLPSDEVYNNFFKIAEKRGLQYFLRAHVLSHQDAVYLSDLVDGVEEFIVSNLTPIGKALLGLARGQGSFYGLGLKVEVGKNKDSIRTSSLFN